MAVVEVFELAKTYETELRTGSGPISLRVEVFRSLATPKLYRCRAFVSNMYNLYPSIPNSGPHGEDLKKMHTADTISAEITYLIADDEDLVRGFVSEDEERAFERTLKLARNVLTLSTAT